MPRIETTTRTLYLFAELNDKVKERARDWWRSLDDGTLWADNVIEDAKDRAAEMGIEIATHPVKLMNGTTRPGLSVYWSGFAQQGDGACFAGTWRAANVNAAALKESAPVDKELHAISDEFARIAALYPDSRFTATHSGLYCHEFSASFECESGIEIDSSWSDENYSAVTALEEAFPQKALIHNARRFMRWIYAQLRKEDEYQDSAECVDENITANEYEFTEDGERA